MNEKQYLRANKRVFLAVTIIFAYITLTMLAALAASHGDHFVRIMIQCLVSVGVIIISALGYLTRKKTHTCAIILTTAMMVGYAAVALLNTTEGTWAYALPLIIAAMVYLNERLMKIINSVFLLVNIVRLMLSFAHTHLLHWPTRCWHCLSCFLLHTLLSVLHGCLCFSLMKT